jgi:hypothetical protein
MHDGADSRLIDGRHRRLGVGAYCFADCTNPLLRVIEPNGSTGTRSQRLHVELGLAVCCQEVTALFVDHDIQCGRTKVAELVDGGAGAKSSADYTIRPDPQETIAELKKIA